MSAEAEKLDIGPGRKHRLPPATKDVRHIPGEDGLPLIGNTLEFLADPRATSRRLKNTYGPVYRSRVLGQYTIALASADALELVMLDRDKNFSSERGWDHTIGRLFSRGLMLMDFDEHRFHRRIMQAAFRRDALEYYMETMNDVVDAGIEPWADAEDFRFYPAIKQLTLDNAAVAFLGLPLGPEASRINKAFIDTVAASVAIVRVPVPGLALWRGLRGRRVLEAFFLSHIPERRGSDQRDMFTQLCNAKTEDGHSFTDRDIVDHMIFLMMAAHDTLTSSLTTAMYGLAANPDWQARLRAEAEATGDGPLTYDQLGELQQTEWLFNEALRLYGPVPYIPRRTVREFEYRGVRIPANAQVGVSPDGAHYDETIWTNPTQFDPERFGPDRQEHKRHAFAFSPYGGGAHKCIGMHFALILAKVFLRRFVRTYDVLVPDDYEYRVRHLPIPKARDGLKVALTRRR